MSAHVSTTSHGGPPEPPTDHPLELPKLEGVEAAKRAAAYKAVDEHVLPEHKIIGIGSGSTVPYVVERIKQQGEKANTGRWFVPTGFQSRELIIVAGLQLGDVDSFPEIDVTIDGADEVDPELNLIKGGGACHLREKVLAEAARTFIVVADHRKASPLLGTAWTQGVPVEVAQFAHARVLKSLREMGSEQAVLRMAKAKAGPVVTDNGNFCIDAPFPAAQMRDPAALLQRIKLLTGVVEVGLFVSPICRAAYFGEQNGTVSSRLPGGKGQTGETFDVTRLPRRQ